MSSEKTAAAAGQVGELRRDPMAMLPFCGYNMAEYWNHWLEIGQHPGAVLPRIYYVNWFRKNDSGDFLWPGFGENSRVLQWVFERCVGKAEGRETPIGVVPNARDLDLSGLAVTGEDVEELLAVDPEAWLREVGPIRDHYAQFGENLPSELAGQLDALEERLKAAIG